MIRRSRIGHVVEVHLVCRRHECCRPCKVRHQVRRRAFGELYQGDRSPIERRRASEVPSTQASDEVLAVGVALQ